MSARNIYKRIAIAGAYAFFLLFPCSADAQRTEPLVKLEHYALDSFTSAIVRLKNGTTTQEKLNYNLVTREMIFMKGNTFLAIGEPASVDTIFVGTRKFVHAGRDGFYEWLSGNTYPLFVEYTCTVKEPGTPVGIGTSNTTASTSLKSLINVGGAYALKLPDGFEVIPKRTLFVRFDNTLHKIKNEQHLTRLFPAKKQFIKEWIHDHKTDFSKNDEVASLMDQLQ